MENEVFGAEHEGALDFAAKGHDALLAKISGLAADVDQVAGVDDQRANVEFCALRAHALSLFGVDLLWTPHAGAGGEDLEGVGANFVRPIDGIGGTARRADVNSDSLGHFSILIGQEETTDCSRYAVSAFPCFPTLPAK